MEKTPRFDTGRGLILAALAVLIAGVYFWATPSPAIFGETEGQYSGASREMLHRGDWIIPTNNEIPRLQKPPLVYWIQIASYRVLGVGEFAARLPNTLFCLGWFVLTGWLAGRVFGAMWGVRAALVLATMLGTFLLGNLIMPEAFLAFFMTGTFCCFVEALRNPDRASRWMFLAWICMALGVFAKGLHGMLYPVVAAGICAWRFPATRGVWRHLLQPAGVGLFLLVLIPWYAAVEARYPGFLMDHFINEQVGHTIDTRYPPDSERVPFLVFWVQHLAFWFPWVLFAPIAWVTWKKAEKPAGPDRAPRFLLWSWLVVNVLTILPSALQDYYTMLTWGVAAIWLTAAWNENSRAGKGLWRIPAVAFGVAGSALLLLALFPSPSVETRGEDGTLEMRSNIANTLTGFSPEVWSTMTPLALVAGASLVVAALATWILAARPDRMPVFYIQIALMAVLMVLSAKGMSAVENYFSHKWAVVTMDARDPGGRIPLVCEGDARINASLLFYTVRPIFWLGSDPAEEFASRVHGVGVDRYMDSEALADNWHSGSGLFLLVERASLDHWMELIGAEELQIIDAGGSRLLLGNFVD